MKQYPHLTSTAIAFLLFTSLSLTKAEPPAQVNASVEIYELSQSQAFAIQKVFSDGTDVERNNILLALRKGTPANGIKTVAVGAEAMCNRTAFNNNVS
jgi:hypothetical protein